MLTNMTKPTIEEIAEYCKKRGNNVDAEQFWDHYQSKGWLVGKSPMKDWQACVRTWERNTTHTMAIKQRDESYRASKEVYMKPLPKPKASPEIAKLTNRSFTLARFLIGARGQAKSDIKKELRDIAKKILVLKDSDSRLGFK